jgi:uncharacterized protein YwqG
MKKKAQSVNNSTLSDLENLLRSMIRESTRMVLEPLPYPPKNSQRISHFGGQPYFEFGEEWPRSNSGDYYDFICQIFNDGKINLPAEVKLVQFFYNFNEHPWQSDESGWRVKVYKKLNPKNMQPVSRPENLRKSPYCNINFEEITVLPCWDSIDRYNETVTDLCFELNENSPWETFQETCEKLAGEQKLESRIGGYARWLQGDATPCGNDGKPMELLLQIDSEDDAGLMWSDMGLVYIFYDKNTGETRFCLQCC